MGVKPEALAEDRASKGGAGLGRPELSRNTHSTYAVTVVIALAPVFLVVALRIPLINQLNYADAWFYSGYAWVPKHHFAVFGWNYFSVRFPAILGIGVFERAFGAGDGYVLLRYLLAIMCGASIYVCVRRFASSSVAIGAVVLLYVNPFFSRMLLWDYAGFIEVAAGVIGIALWYWSDSRRLAWTLLPGAAFATAVFANALVGTVLLVLFGVEAFAAVRQGKSATLCYAARLGVVAGATVGIFVVGYLSYVAILGSLSPYDLLRPTIKAFGENNKNSSPYRQPVSAWLLHEPRIWAPVITSVALVAVLRLRILGGDIAARIAQVCVAYTAFLWLFRFLVTSSVIETWWAYSIVVVAMAPAVGVLLHEFADSPTYARRRSVLVVGVFTLTAIFIRNLPNTAANAYHALSEHEALLIVLLLTGVVSAMCMGLGRVAGRVVASTVFVMVLATMLYAPSILDGRGTTGIFVTSGSQEWRAYSAGERFIDLVREYDNPNRRVFLWYPGTFGYVSMAWTDLPQDADTVNQVGVSESVEQLTPLGVARLMQPDVGYVMILSPQFGDLVKAREALARGGFAGNMLRDGVLAEGRLHYALVVLNKK
jgi:hypothetical protein